MAPVQPRSGPVIKASNLCSIAAFRVDKRAYSQSAQFFMSAGLFIIDQFRIHREGQVDSSTQIESDDDEVIKRRISYTREQKLGAISYATTIWKIQSDETFKLISKRAATSDFEINRSMLQQWLANKSDIEITTKGTRKHRFQNIVCQEPEMEERLLKLFIEARNNKKKTINR